MLNKFMGPLMAIYVFSKPFLKSLQQVLLRLPQSIPICILAWAAVNFCMVMMLACITSPLCRPGHSTHCSFADYS